MSKFVDSTELRFTRRSFLIKAAASTGFCLLNCEVEAQKADGPKPKLALDDENVILGKMQFASGGGTIDGYLSRPNAKGRFPVVIVVTGNSVDEKYVQNMTAMLAQNGFIGIAPNIFSLQKDSMTPDEKRKVFIEQITDERIFQDLQAAIDYLKTQSFANVKKIGITGFCFGGRCALMFAAHSKQIDAVVPFYGNLQTPAFANRKADPLDVMDKIRVPVQGHYAKADAEIPPEQLKAFEDALRKRRAPVEIFTYDAAHGFFAFERKSYDLASADLSWQRTVVFFRKYLSK